MNRQSAMMFWALCAMLCALTLRADAQSGNIHWALAGKGVLQGVTFTVNSANTGKGPGNLSITLVQQNVTLLDVSGPVTADFSGATINPNGTVTGTVIFTSAVRLPTGLRTYIYLTYQLTRANTPNLTISVPGLHLDLTGPAPGLRLMASK